MSGLTALGLTEPLMSQKNPKTGGAMKTNKRMLVIVLVVQMILVYSMTVYAGPDTSPSRGFLEWIQSLYEYLLSSF
jgi:hypothetical protein